MALGAKWWVLISARFLLAALAAYAVSFILRPKSGVVVIKHK
jgi:LPS O-antigen subunit length determinant protein (WzzB/FepE family)